MTHPRSGPPDEASTAGAGAEKAAFLRDLRALRDQAGLGPRDLAARAHFPEATLTTAEAGPDLPSLPVLQAYVRGCGAGEAEWEDRWRRLNAADGTDGSVALPTRAPSSVRPPARVMPFPVAGSGPGEPEQEAIGFGLARVARGLVPISPDPADDVPPDLPTRTPFGSAPSGNGAMRPSTEYSAAGNGTAEAGGWFDPAPKTSAPPPAASPPAAFTPPSAAPPSPPGNSGAPTVQYPAVSGYQPPGYQASERTYQPSSYSTPSGRLPEEFRTPVPPPADLSGSAGGATSAPAAPGGTGVSGLGPSGFGASGAGSGATSPGTAPASGSPAPSDSRTPGATSASAATPKPHAAPAAPRRGVSGWVVAAVIVLLIIAAAIWLLLSH